MSFDSKKCSFKLNHKVKPKACVSCNENSFRHLTIDIQMLNGKTFQLHTEPNDTIGFIKIKIQNKYGITRESQRLIYCGYHLNDVNTLNHYKINKDSTVHLAFKLGWRSQINTNKHIKYIYVKRPSGKYICLTFNKNDTILYLKKQIFDKDYIPISCQTLIFLSKRLHNDKTLLSYNIKEEYKLHLLVQPIQIFIKTLNNEIFSIKIHSTATILYLKKLIASIVNISIEEQKMIFNEKILYNYNRINQCKLSNFDIIHLNINFVNLYQIRHEKVLDNMNTVFSPIRKQLKADIQRVNLLSEGERKIDEITSLCSFNKNKSLLLLEMKEHSINMDAVYEEGKRAKEIVKHNHYKRLDVTSLDDVYSDYNHYVGTLDDIYQKTNGLYTGNVASVKFNKTRSILLHCINIYEGHVEKIMQIVSNIKQYEVKYKNKYEIMLENNLKAIDKEIKSMEKLYTTKMDCIERLQEITSKKMKYFEKRYDEMNTNELITWIKMIENEYFSNDKFEMFFNALNEIKISGNELNEINSKLFLNTVGLKDENAQYILRKHINRIIQYKIDTEYNNICGFCTDHIINTVFLNCCHQFSCYECSLKLLIGDLKCPICRQNVIQIQQTYMSGFTRLNK